MVPSPAISGAREKILNVMEQTMKLKILTLSSLVILALALCCGRSSRGNSPAGRHARGIA
jgi:hypothetical protein